MSIAGERSGIDLSGYGFGERKASRGGRGAAISQSHLQRQFNELILVRVAAFGEGLEDLHEKKGL